MTTPLGFPVVPDVKKIVERAVRDLGKITKPQDVSKAPRIVAPLVGLRDYFLGETIVALAYAPYLGDPRELLGPDTDLSHRHNFGLKSKPGVSLEYFTQTSLRRTFTYCKPLVVEPNKAPRELNRFDSKNWTPTQKSLQDKFSALLVALSATVDAVIILDQVDVAETGVVTPRLLTTLGAIGKARPELLVIADSRRGLHNYPPVCLKMNRSEFATLTGLQQNLIIEELKTRALELARQRSRMVFVTAAEAGMVGASPAGDVEYSPALPLRGAIDVVGAGDAVTANLASSLAAGATLKEALHIANTAASIVIHQLGTTGTASLHEIRGLSVAAAVNA